MDEKGRRAGGRHRFRRRRSGRSGAGHFSPTRSSARSDSAGDRWAAHARPGIEPLSSRISRCAGEARLLDAREKKYPARCFGVSPETVIRRGGDSNRRSILHSFLPGRVGVESAHKQAELTPSAGPSCQEETMRRTVLLLSAILLASFGISY